MEREIHFEKIIEEKSVRDAFIDEMLNAPAPIEKKTTKKEKNTFDDLFSKKIESKNNKNENEKNNKELFGLIKSDRRTELTLSDEEIFDKAMEMYEFIRSVYLPGETKEIRMLSRNKFRKGYSPRLESIFFWSLPTKEQDADKYRDNIKKIYDSLKRMNGLAFCTYIGSGVLKYNQEAMKGFKLMLCNETLVGADFFVMDLDDCSEEYYNTIKQQLLSVDIETVDVYTGHGYQMLFLLKERCFELTAQKVFKDKLFYDLKWGIDESIDSFARLNRCVSTFNCKEYQLGEKRYKGEAAKPKETKLIEKTSRRYSVQEIFDALDELKSRKTLTKNEDGLYVDEDGFFNPYENFKKELEENDAESFEMEEYTEDIEESFVNEEKNEQNDVDSVEEGTIHLDSYFSEIPFDDLPKSVRNIFIRIKEKTTYDVCMYLAPMFANKLMFTYNQTKRTLEKMLRINERLSYDDFVSKCLSMYETVKEDNQNGLFGKITNNLIQAYGDELHYKIDEAVLLKNRNKIIINNKDFDLLRQSAKEKRLLKAEKKALQMQIKELENKKIGAAEKVIARLNNAIDDLKKEVKNKDKKIEETLSSKDFRILIAARQIMHDKGQTWFTLKDLAKVLGCHIETVKTNVKPLLKEQLIIRRKNSKKDEESYEYVLNNYKNNSDHHSGYTKVEPGTARAMLKELGNSELVLYLKMLSMPEGTILSQETWGNSIGIERKTVNKIFGRLQEEGWIRIIQVFIDEKGEVTLDQKKSRKIMTQFIINYL